MTQHAGKGNYANADRASAKALPSVHPDGHIVFLVNI
jgi:hypothetical protein